MGLRLRNSGSDNVFQGRDALPTHYSFKIESFSTLVKASIDKYSSDKFEAGDHKWTLSIYPTGNKERGGNNHISIFLTLMDTTSLPAGWEVKANFNFFVLDQPRDKYFSISDTGIRRFHAMKTQWGISKFIELEIFNDSTNGYLVQDTCVFGIEIFVLKQTRKGECLSLLESPRTGNHIWKVNPFSTLTLERYESSAFVVGDYKWKIRLYPRGNGDGKGNSISVFLCLDESTLPPDTRPFVKFILRVVDQGVTNPEPFEFKADNHFGSSCLVWGAQKFMSLAKLNDKNKSFLVNDTAIIEADVTLLGTLTPA